MKFKVGDKVRVNGSDGASPQLVGKIFEVIRADPYDGPYKYSLKNCCEGFCESELDRVKGAKMNTRRTFKLLKDTPEVSKGALFQEACDDGDQEYVLLDDGYLTNDDFYDFYEKLSFSRNAVEDQPNWFEEVEMQWLPKVVRTTKIIKKKVSKK